MLGFSYPGLLLGLPFDSGWEMTPGVMGINAFNFDGSKPDVIGLVGSFKANKLGYWWIDNNRIDKYILTVCGHNQKLDLIEEDCAGLSLL